MPVYDPRHVEYSISSGHVQIVMDDGQQFPAYWAHPNVGSRMPGIGLLHDWWGLTDVVRRMVHQFAQLGFYVIAPDMFDGRVATTPKEAMELIQGVGEPYPRIDAA